MEEKERRLRMRASSSVTNEAIERVLELSADAQIERRRMTMDSPGFYALTGEIAAYGKALTLLVALQEQEELYAAIAQLSLRESVILPPN
jgi:hypothetical protein